MNIEIEYMYANIKPPKYATDGSSGFDLIANNFQRYYDPSSLRSGEKTQEYLDLKDYPKTGFIIYPKGRLLVGCGYKLAIPTDYELQIRARSGWALKCGLALANGTGTFDSDYRGEVAIILINTSAFGIKVYLGDALAQGVICPVTRPDKFIRVGRVSPTVRGEKGYGSSGGDSSSEKGNELRRDWSETIDDSRREREEEVIRLRNPDLPTHTFNPSIE